MAHFRKNLLIPEIVFLFISLFAPQILGLQSSQTISNFGVIGNVESYALRFDGVDDYVEVCDSISLHVSKITMELWIMFTSIPSSWNGIITKWRWAEEGFPGYHVVTENAENILVFGVSDNANAMVEKESYSTEVETNRWHYYAFTYDGFEMREFLDGKLRYVRSFTGAIGINSLPLTIGCISDITGFFKGAIDEVRISKTARSADEICSNYNNGTIKELGVDTNTVALWHFDEGNGNTAHDETENHNDGTIHGCEWIPEGYEEERNVDIHVDFGSQVGTNQLSLGTQFNCWKNIVADSELSLKAEKCNFGLIRFFVGGNGGPEPCTLWNEENHSGTYDWKELDELVQAIKQMGAQPLICIGGGSSKEGYWLPSGMVGDYEETRFPSNESFGTYCADIVNHINIERGEKVTYWEIWNEPDVLDDVEKIGNFTKTFNNAWEYMNSVDPSILCGNDRCSYKVFFDYFAQYARGVGFLSFHKYDAEGTWLCNPEGYISDYLALKMAGRMINYDWAPNIYTPMEMQRKWKEARGEALPVLCSETNLNSAFENGTDPRIQEPIGGAWYAEEVGFFILSGVKYLVYYDFASDDSSRWETTKLTGGWGFGLVRGTSPYDEWYPYLVNYLIGNSISVGCPLFDVSSNSTDAVSALAWKRGSQLKLLLICKVDRPVNVKIEGLPEGEMTIYCIDGSCREIQSEVTTARQINMVGYTVLLVSSS